MNWKGIVLAGGSGTRLQPLTDVVSKQLLPVFDKPMIYYSLSILFLSRIREILIITAPDSLNNFKELLGDGSDFGASFHYAIQEKPTGIPDAFILGEDFIGNSNVSLILGDNFIFGQNLTDYLEAAKLKSEGATIFGYQITDPKEFGVVEFDDDGGVISIEEKPLEPKSNYAVIGLYFYDNKVIELAKALKPSNRNETEITDLNKLYINNGLDVQLLNRGFAWLDTGTHENLLSASQFVQTIQNRQGFKIACLEEIAYKNGWISSKDLLKKASSMKSNEYSLYLESIATTE